MTVNRSGFITENVLDRLDRMMSNLQNVLPNEDISEGTYNRQLLSIVAAELFNIESDVYNISTNRDLSLAEDYWLDSLGQLIGITRNNALPSTGTLRVFGTINTTVPEGFTVEDSDGNRYRTSESGLIGSDGYVDVSIVSTERGNFRSNNNTITNIINTIDNIESVTNNIQTDFGSDLESNVNYRSRLLRGLIGGNTLRNDLERFEFVDRVVIFNEWGGIRILVSDSILGLDRIEFAMRVFRHSYVRTLGSQSETITVNGLEEVVRWSTFERIPVQIRLNIDYIEGFTADNDFNEIIDLEIDNYFDSVEGENELNPQDLLCLLKEIPQIRRVEVLFFNSSNILTIETFELAIRGTVTISGL